MNMIDIAQRLGALDDQNVCTNRAQRRRALKEQRCKKKGKNQRMTDRAAHRASSIARGDTMIDALMRML